MPVTNGTTTSLGFVIKVKNIPTDIETAEQQAGTVGAVLQAYIKNVKYRGGINGEAREIVSAKIAEATGVARLTKTETVKGKDGAADTTEEVYAETEDDHVTRALAQVGKKASDFQSLFDDVELDFAEAAKPGRSAAGPKGPNKGDLTVATTWLTFDTAIVEKAVEKLQTDNPGVTVVKGEDGKYSAESLALAFAADRKRKEALAKSPAAFLAATS